MLGNCLQRRLLLLGRSFCAFQHLIIIAIASHRSIAKIILNRGSELPQHFVEDSLEGWDSPEVIVSEFWAAFCSL